MTQFDALQRLWCVKPAVLSRVSAIDFELVLGGRPRPLVCFTIVERGLIVGAAAEEVCDAC